ncbi:sodium:solute symporter [Mariniphaga sediminis]|uniref:Sodium:solute symporter n=1 Tax=Mariniphaga sediminis TaxID=1628158 RepID=A0A399D3I3_9BACT|nr:sodium/solute symporter [Mariniphaga sediminis]RIH64970.1 sodium:solute symporter [Mariniphaga sediminis]
MKYLLSILSLYIFILNIRAESNYFTFSTLPDLPPNTGYSVQPGLAGPYTGTDDDILIIAGGANFPGRMPWEGGTKKYYDEIFILTKDAEGKYKWKTSAQKIPYLAAYGGALETSNGLFCFGGNTDKDCISESWFIDYRPESEDVEIKPGPALPVPLTNFASAKVDGYIYVAGGVSSPGGASGLHFFRLQVTGENPTEWGWEELPAWDGAPRAFAVGVGQSNGETNCFYLFSGRNVQPRTNPKILHDAHVFNPFLREWSVISDGSNPPFPVMAGTAFPAGASTIVFASGANGEQMKKQLVFEKQISELRKLKSSGQPVQDKLDQAEKELLDHLQNHPGFGNRLMAFNTLTHVMYEAGKLLGAGQVTTRAVTEGKSVFVPSGEIRPGVRTPSILKIDINPENRHLSWLDVLVIALYFLVLSWMGYFFSKRQKDTNDYFKGGGRVPWWAAGLSIFGTALSAITFMAIPAKTYATDWSYFMLNMTIFMVAPIIVFLFIPFYRKLNITTAYEYLENRFNLAVRLIGSLSFILFQVGRMGVVMFLPSIALNVATGIDIFVCIALMGVISLVYTMLGGIEAVIWTDVMQVIVLLGGALLSLVLITFAVDGGLGSIVEVAANNHKFNVTDLTWSLKQPTLWVMLLGGIFASITTYGTDQTMVQRYLTTKTQKEAKKSVWTNAILTIPATLIFFFVGTALFVFYKTYPAELNPTFANNDAIFPWYIASQLPRGISGLLIAGIFAAAMSSLSSSMNSAATAYSTDIHFRFKWNKKVSELNIARRATLVIGIAGTLFAFFMATADVKSLWDEFQRVLGLVIGSLGGVFLLGILSKRANSFGALSGIAVSIVVQVLVSVNQTVHLLVFSATGVISCFVAGYIFSLLKGGSKEK